MLTPTIEKLLILQDRDQARLSLEAQLRAVPRDRTAIEQKIAAERAAIDVARGEWQGLEARKKACENEIAAAGETLARYKSQQLQVRKNDEYQALGVEIGHTQEKIDALEEDELKLLYAIDEAKVRFAAAEAESKRNIAGDEARIQALREREATLQAALSGAQTATDTAREPIDEATLRLYDRLATKPGLPAVVPIREGKCEGCHLRISFNVDSEIRRADKVVTCDQCARIVYWEA
jgi:uncharacterized protein